MDLPSSRFWDFSLEIYAKPGVAQACLALQDECGADVNLLLFCCWAGPLDEIAMRRGVVVCVGQGDAVFLGMENQRDSHAPCRCRRRALANGGVAALASSSSIS